MTLPDDGAPLETRISGWLPALHYRGWPVSELQPHTWEETVALLIYGVRPDADLIADTLSRLAEAPRLEPAVQETVNGLPWPLSLMEVLRSGLDSLSHFDENPDDRSVDAHIDRFLNCLPHVAQMIASRYCSTQGVPCLQSDDHDSLAARLLLQLRGLPPSELEREVFSSLLVLFAEEPDCPAALAVRATAGATGDVYSALMSGLSVLQRSHPGLDAEDAFLWLDELESSDAVDRAEAELRQHRDPPPGFTSAGAVADPRPDLLKQLCRRLAADREQTAFEELADRFETLVREELGRVPDVAWPLARLFHYLGLEHELVGPLVLLARISGWAAHYLEQYGQPLRMSWRYVK